MRKFGRLGKDVGLSPRQWDIIACLAKHAYQSLSGCGYVGGKVGGYVWMCGGVQRFRAHALAHASLHMCMCRVFNCVDVIIVFKSFKCEDVTHGGARW